MADSRALALVLLVALAGCNGALGPLDGDDAPASDEEPALPPGVTDQSVNATALLDAHVESLENQSFALHYELSANTQSSDVVAHIGPERERAAVRIERGDQTEEYFLAGGVQYEFQKQGGQTQYYVVNQSSAASGQFVQRYVRPTEIRSLIVAGEWTTDGTTDCANGACWVLRATEANASGPLADAENFDARAVVAPSGRVTDISATIERPNDTGNLTLSITDVGETTVTRPDWVSAANQSGTRIGFDQSPEPEPESQRIEREFDGQNGSVAVLGAHEDADYGDLETRSVGIAPDNPVVNATVGWFVSADFTAPYEEAVVELGYNESRIPEGGTESELGLYRLNYTTNRHERLDATLDSANDTMVVRVENVTGIYAVFHAPTFEELRNETATESRSTVVRAQVRAVEPAFSGAPRSRSSASRR